MPRPRALKAFHSLFVGIEITVVFGEGGDGGEDVLPLEVVMTLPVSEGQSEVEVRLPLSQCSNGASINSETFVVEECATLSNCARLDVILVLATTPRMTNEKTTNEAARTAARYAVAYHLQQQVVSQRTKNTLLLERSGLSSWLDLPGVINLEKDSTTTDAFTAEQSTKVNQLGQRLTSMEGSHSISYHLALIAGGLAPRPNRPDREVIFRPYSSRDAHILLQLKRTVEVISTLNAEKEKVGRKETRHTGSGRIKTLLDGALSAGKAARNERAVPEIKRLKEYGSDGTPPAALADVVAKVRRWNFPELLCVSLAY